MSIFNRFQHITLTNDQRNAVEKIEAFIHGEIAHTEYMFGLTLVVVLLIGVGTWFFNRNIKRIAEFF